MPDAWHKVALDGVALVPVAVGTHAGRTLCRQPLVDEELLHREGGGLDVYGSVHLRQHLAQHPFGFSLGRIPTPASLKPIAVVTAPEIHSIRPGPLPTNAGRRVLIAIGPASTSRTSPEHASGHPIASLPRSLERAHREGPVSPNHPRGVDGALRLGQCLRRRMVSSLATAHDVVAGMPALPARSHSGFCDLSRCESGSTSSARIQMTCMKVALTVVRDPGEGGGVVPPTVRASPRLMRLAGSCH